MSLDFEALLHESPDDPDLWRIYADHLMMLGDPRGEYIARFVGAEDSPEALDAHDALLARGQRVWLGGPAGPSVSLWWRFGFLQGVAFDKRAARDQDGLAQDVARLLGSDAARFLQSLSVDNSEQNDAQGAADAAARGMLGGLRTLTFRAGRGPRTLDLSAVLARTPRLGELQMIGSGIFIGDPELPRLSVLDLVNPGPDELAAAASGRFPALRHLALRRSARTQAAAETPLDPIFQRADLLLRTFILSYAQDADRIAARLVRAPWAAGLETLELSSGELTDAGAVHLLIPGVLPSLRRLSAPFCRLSDAAVQKLEARFEDVNLQFQRGS